jgi:cation diffusion facilitator CzcD-associated flavoprotein CzcO
MRGRGGAPRLALVRTEDGDLPEAVDVLIVGAGHAGLAMSHFLTRAGREHVVL